MTDSEVAARLGEAAGEFRQQVGQEGFADLAAAIEVIGRRYSGSATEEDREAAIAAAMACGLGRETLAGLAEAWREAKTRERAAMAALTGGIAWASTHDHHTDSRITRETGLSTKSVRKALSR